METEKPMHVLGDRVILKACGDARGVDASMVEVTTQPGGGPPLHRHSREDEMFYVLEGRLRIWRGDETFEAGAGEALLLPRGVAHTFRNDGDVPSRMLVTMVPAGFEGFFRECSERGLTPEHADAVVDVAARYGLEILGPPPG